MSTDEAKKKDPKPLKEDPQGDGSVLRLLESFNIRSLVRPEDAKEHFIRESNHNALAHDATEAFSVPFIRGEYLYLAYGHDGTPPKDLHDLMGALSFSRSKDIEKGFFGNGFKYAGIALAQSPQHIEIIFAARIGGGKKWSAASLRHNDEAVAAHEDATEQWGEYVSQLLAQDSSKYKVLYIARVGKTPPQLLSALDEEADGNPQTLIGLPVKTIQRLRLLDPTNFNRGPKGAWNKKSLDLVIMQRTINAPDKANFADNWPAMLKIGKAHKVRGLATDFETVEKFDAKFLHPGHTFTYKLKNVETRYSHSNSRYILNGDYEVTIKLYHGFVAHRGMLVPQQGGSAHRIDSFLGDTATFRLPVMEKLGGRQRFLRFATDPVAHIDYVKRVLDPLNVSTPMGQKYRTYTAAPEDWKGFAEVTAERTDRDSKEAKQLAIARHPWVFIDVAMVKFHGLDVDEDGKPTPYLRPEYPGAAFQLPSSLGGVASLFVAHDQSIIKSIMISVMKEAPLQHPLVVQDFQEKFRRVFPSSNTGAIPMPLKQEGMETIPRLRVAEADHGKTLRTLKVDSTLMAVITEPPQYFPKSGLRINEAQTRGVVLKDHKDGFYQITVGGYQRLSEDGNTWEPIQESEWKPNRRHSPSHRIYVIDKQGREYRLDCQVATPTTQKNPEPEPTGKPAEKPPKKAGKKGKELSPKFTSDYWTDLGTPDYYYEYRDNDDPRPNIANPSCNTLFMNWNHAHHPNLATEVRGIHNTIVQAAAEIRRHPLKADATIFESDLLRERYDDNLNWYVHDTVARWMIQSARTQAIIKEIEGFKGQ